MKVAKEYYMSPLEKGRIPWVEKAKMEQQSQSSYRINYSTMSFDFNKTYEVVF
jgi:hypothetical protein